MNFSGYEYYKIHHAALSFAGLWAYDDSLLDKIKRVLWFTVLMTGFVFQVTVYVSGPFQVSAFLRNYPIIVCTFFFIIKYGMFYFNTNEVMNIFEFIQADWNRIADENELNIMRTYSYFGKRVTIVATLCVTSAACFVMLNVVSLYVLDVMAPLNVSRLNKIPLEFEYFFDQEKYRYLLIIHVNFIAVMGTSTLLATTMTIVMFVQHACGMFKVASYRITRAINDNDVLNGDKECMTCLKLIQAIYAHRRAIELIEYIETISGRSYFLLLLMGISGTSVTMYCLCHAILFTKDFKEISINAFLACVQLGYTYIANYVGQTIIDHSNEVWVQTYDTKWYRTPIHVQKLIMFIMQRSMKYCVLNIGGVYISSHEGFLSMCNLSFSYFMVVYNTR